MNRLLDAPATESNCVMYQQRDSDSESEQQPRANSPNDYRARRGDSRPGKASDGVDEIDQDRLDARTARQRFGDASLRKRGGCSSLEVSA